MKATLPASGSRVPSPVLEEATDAPADFSAYWDLLREKLSACHGVLIRRFFAALPQDMLESIDSQVKGGKKLRARILCTMCEALGGDFADALPRAMAVECIQAASLIHDDWVDGDRVRRNAPAAWTVQGARRAVLLADVIFATALERSAELGRLDVLCLAKAIAAIAAGAYQEPLDLPETSSNRLHAPDNASSYDRLIFLKTGALFAAAAELGAIGARAHAAMRRAAYDYGARIGEAYQLADDLEDLVRGPAFASPASRHMAALSMLLTHFGIAADEGCDASRFEVGQRDGIGLDQLEQAMKDEIGARIALARIALKKLPRTPWRGLLEAIPEQIVRRKD